MWRQVTCAACLAVGWVLIQGNLAFAFNPDRDSSLVGCWKLDESSGVTANDSSGNGNNGAIQGNPAWTTGKLKGALDLNGSSDYVDCGNSPLFNFNDAITVSVWVNLRIVPTAWMCAVSKGENAWRISANNTSQTFHFGITYYTNANYSANGAIQVGLNEWHHVTGTYDGKDIRLYVDGVLDTTTTGASPLGTSTTSLFIGENSESRGRYWNGLIDDVRVYRKAVSASDISVIMSGVWDPIAEGPNPADKRTDVPRDAVLSWIAGPYAKTHDVYLGTVFDDVNNASVAAPNGVLVSRGQTTTTFDPAGLLSFGQTYYWRVDEVNGAPDSTTYKGGVWSFKAESYGYPITKIKATASGVLNASMGPEKTIDGSGMDATDGHGTSATTMWVSKKNQSPIWIQYEFDTEYKLHQMWVWNSNQLVETIAPFGAQHVKIETSKDGATWTALGDVFEFAQAPGEEGYTHNTTVDFGGVQAKFVKLTIVDNWSDGTKQASLSEVRFFYVPVRAYNPTPANAAKAVAVDSVLNWRPGREAVKHEVYLSADAAAVAAGTAPFKTVTEHSIGLASLNPEYARTYTWKVNEVNEAAAQKSWEGDLWTLSTPEFGVVDDFESYDDNCKRIFFVWVDGYGYSESTKCNMAASAGNGSGSTVGNTNPPFAEKTIVHGGMQSMPMAYDNTTGKSTSEAIRTFESAQDWTAGGAKTLVLYFAGTADNTAGQLYVKINGTRVNYPGGTAALSMSVWKQWNVDLTQIPASTLKAVKTMAVGVSDSGKGLLRIDDIALYRLAPAVPVPADPATNGLLANYKMEANVKDSSGKNNNGTANGDPVYVDGPVGSGSALKFDGIDDYVDLPIGSAISAASSMTLSLWANWSAQGGNWQRILDFGGPTPASGTPDTYMFLAPSAGASLSSPLRFAIRMASSSAESTVSAVGTLPAGWHHVAVVIDGSTKTMQLTLDGSIVGSAATLVVPKDLGATTQNWLGRSQYTADAYYNGLIDELRIYNRALSVGEVRYLAGDR